MSDYFSPEVFLKMAQDCSVEDTAHSAHFMNWPLKVYGTNLLDYGDNKQEIYNKCMGSVKDSNINKMFLQKGVRQDTIDHPINKFGELICIHYQQEYSKWYFGE